MYKLVFVFLFSCSSNYFQHSSPSSKREPNNGDHRRWELQPQPLLFHQCWLQPPHRLASSMNNLERHQKTTPQFNQHLECHLLLTNTDMVYSRVQWNWKDVWILSTKHSKVINKRLKLSQQRSRRLAKKVKSMETVIRDLKEKNLLSQQAAENLSASFSGGALELIKRCMNKGQNSKAVYPAELRAFALTLQFYSARAYDYVRQTFNNCLPHPKTLSEWYSCINGDPGFHDEIFAALKEKAEQCDGGRILCSFMMVLSKTVLFKGQ